MDISLSRSVIQKKFKIDDGRSKYMEQSTMLEPQNNATEKYEDEEEMREISGQLSQLKKKFDIVKKQVVAMEENVTRVEKEIAGLDAQENKAELAIYETSTRVNQIRDAIDTTKAKLEEEQMGISIYKHMIDRMNKDLIALSLQKKEMEQSLGSKEAIHAEEVERGRKCQEDNLQSQKVLNNLMRNVGDEQTDRKKRIKDLNQSIRKKEKNIQNRQEREAHQREIAETAANESKDQNEKKMRVEFMIHKMWNAFMRKKMEREMKKSAHIDDAFKEIKTKTGVNDVQKLVHNFLTREQTYAEMMMAVVEEENRIEELKKKNEQVSERLHTLNIGSEADAEDNQELV